jgi:hypothetical protein
MCQGEIEKLCKASQSCHVRKVARLLARPLSLLQMAETTGTHTLRLKAIYEPGCNSAGEAPRTCYTSTNGDDNFTVTYLEIPD